MKKILNLGSLNIDHVYSVDHFVRPGETLAALGYKVFAGGKGLNQSVALARAGSRVFHLGMLGPEGKWLADRLKQDGVDISWVNINQKEATGHAMIQVDRAGENAILIYGGANRAITGNEIKSALDSFQAGDWLLAQNETSGVAEAISLAHDRGMKIAFNPAPMSDEVLKYPLPLVDLFIVNETEAEQLSGERETDSIRRTMTSRFPLSASVLTLGEKGAWFFDRNQSHFEPAEKVQAIDTTAAGDTFIGYFLTEFLATNNPAKALTIACHASAICVTRPGAADSIPSCTEL